MASRRMFSKDVVCSDRFLDMPASAQALYFQYGLEADDDGFVSAPKKILASKLFITLTEGCGYDKICTFASVPARKTDYQAYLRKALKILNDMLLLKNMPADFPAEKI